jgi:hypothetical protein
MARNVNMTASYFVTHQIYIVGSGNLFGFACEVLGICGK